MAVCQANANALEYVKKKEKNYDIKIKNTILYLVCINIGLCVAGQTSAECYAVQCMTALKRETSYKLLT